MKRTLAIRTRRNALRYVALGGLALFCQTICHAADLTRVVFEGEAVPGVAGATVGYPTPLTVSADGKIVGNFDFSEPGTGTPRNMVFYSSGPGAAIQKVITSGDAAPDSGGAIYTGHWDASISDAGQILLDARFGSTKALMAGSVGSLSTVIYEGQTRSEVIPGAVVTSIPSFALNRSGQLGYLAYLGGSMQAIWFGSAGSETVVLQKDEDGLSGLPAEASFALLEAMVMNDDGDICVSGTIRPDPMIPAIYDGLWRRVGGSISELIREGDSAPGGGTWGQNPRFRSIANSGWSTFTAETSNDQGGLFVATGSSVTRVLRHDSGFTDPAPGTGGAAFVIDFNSTTTSFQVSSSGRVMLRAGLQSGTGSPAVTFNTNVGIWAGSGGSLNLLVRKGDPIPGFDPGITLYNIFDSGMAADGRIYFSGSGSDFISRLWVDDGSGNFSVVAQRGSTVDKLGGDVPIFNVALRSDLGNGADGRATLMTSDGKVLTRVSQDGNSYPYGIALTGGLGGGTGNITGSVRFDEDQDGDFGDAGDPPFTDVDLKLFADDGTETLTPTGSQIGASVQPSPVDGSYEFNNLPPGTYVVVAELGSTSQLNGTVVTAPLTSKHQGVVTANGTDSGNDFLFFTPGSISGEIRLDLDRDGDFADAEDTPFDGVLLHLYADDGMGTITPTGPILDTVSPDPLNDDPLDGFYEFTNVAPGTYVVVAELTTTSISNNVVFTAPAENKRLAVVTAGATDSGNDFLCFKPIVLFSMLAATQQTVNPSLAQDSAPNNPTTDPIVLAAQPRLDHAGGLAADGVTPLVIELKLNEPPLDRPLRWEYSVVRGGTVKSDFSFSLRDRQLNLESSPFWDYLSTSSPHVVTPIAAGNPGAGTAYVSLNRIDADDLMFDSADLEIELEFRVYDEGSGALLSQDPIRLRRPPLFLIGSSPFEPWGSEFLNVVHTSRKPEFVKQLNFTTTTPSYNPGSSEPYYLLSEVVEGLGWDQEIDALRQSWAFSFPDAVGHGTGGNLLLGLCQRGGEAVSGFRGGYNFWHGRFRRGITIGTDPILGVGIVGLYGLRMEKTLAASELAGFAGISYIPEMLKRVPAWHRDYKDALARASLRTGPTTGHHYDDEAEVYLMATRVDTAQSLAYRMIGFSPEAESVLTPSGSDGVVGVDEATHGGSSSQLLPGFIAHGRPETLFGNAPRQTNSGGVATRVMELLDGIGTFGFDYAEDLEKDWETIKPKLKVKVSKVDELVDQEIHSGLSLIVEILASPPPPEGFAGAAASPPPSIDYVFEIQPAPGAPSVGNLTWFAEVFGVGGVSSDGVTVTPDSGNPLRVTVSVDAEVIGDVVLYATYQSGGKTVFATPIRVVSIEPPSATAQSITLDPSSVTVDLGDEVRPVVWVHYSDGSSIRRWVTPSDISVGSSSGAIVDVSDAMNWKGAGVGSATVTLNYAGLMAQSSIQVVNANAPQTYAAWRALHFTPAELADPTISGDLADYDGDRASTIMEYLTAGSPFFAEGRNGLPTIEAIDLGTGAKPALNVRLSKRISGEDVAVEKSTNLTDWQDLLPWTGTPPPIGGRLLAAFDGPGYYDLWFDIEDPLIPREFYRLGVNNNTPTFTSTGTTEFVFGGFSSTGYGDRVTGTMDGSFVYGGSDAFTPNIEAVFVGFTSAWNTGFGDLQQVIYTSSGGPLRIDLVADFGFAVQLDHFDLAGYGADHTIDSVEIQDGSGAVLWSQQNVVALGSSHIRLDFTGLNLTSNILTIVVDGTNIAAGSDEVGLDNLQFKQVPTATLGNWSMLTFESGQSSYVDLDTSYGQRITSATMGSFSYVGAGSFTPGIVVDYLPAASMVHAIGDYGLLQHVIYKKEFFATPFEIQLTADAGQEVQLLGFDLAGYTPSDYTVNSVKVLDGLSGELFSELNFHVAGERTRIDFSAAPLQSGQITIQIDATNLGSSSDNVAIDNISFEQVAAPQKVDQGSVRCSPRNSTPSPQAIVPLSMMSARTPPQWRSASKVPCGASFSRKRQGWAGCLPEKTELPIRKVRFASSARS